MKKIINKSEDFIKEMLEGIYLAHGDMVGYAGDDLHCLVSKHKKPGKVGIATGGGSGHLPLFLGYVGEGMLDGCSIGDVFQSPSAEQMLAVTKEIDSGAGVLYIYGNYNGDIFNFDMAAEMADFEEGIRVQSVVAGEDVASAGPAEPGAKNTRRGVAGIFFVYKCAGAAADEMMPLEEVKRIAEKACANVRTMGAVSYTHLIVPGDHAALKDLKTDYTIVTIPKATGLAWFQRMDEGVKQFAADTGVDAYQNGPAEADAAQQAQYVEAVSYTHLDVYKRQKQDRVYVQPDGDIPKQRTLTPRSGYARKRHLFGRGYGHVSGDLRYAAERYVLSAGGQIQATARF